MISSIAFALLLAAAGNSAHGASMWSIFNCSGAIVSCTPMSGYPRLIEARCGHPGAGSLTVTDSKGVSQTLSVTVLPRSH